jgi:purine-binding chemotaxis protein CheW
MANKKARVIQQMIGFRLDREWFALPILAIHRVVPLGKIYGDPKNTGISLTTYEDRELLVIDVAKQIFNDVKPTEDREAKADVNLANFGDLEQQRYLLILENEGECMSHNFLGLPIDSPPTMYRVESNAFKPIPEAYLDRGNIQCISSQIIELPNLPGVAPSPLFILDRQKLLATTRQLS